MTSFLFWYTEVIDGTSPVRCDGLRCLLHALSGVSHQTCPTVQLSRYYFQMERIDVRLAPQTCSGSTCPHSVLAFVEYGGNASPSASDCSELGAGEWNAVNRLN